jgi:hypothetical protein
MLDQPIFKSEYFKRNKYTHLIVLFILGGLITGILEGVATLNPGRGAAIGLGIMSVALVIYIAGSIAYVRYVKAWYKSYKQK